MKEINKRHMIGFVPNMILDFDLSSLSTFIFRLIFPIIDVLLVF